MRITVLAGGVGGARFLLGVKAFLGWPAVGPGPGDADPADATDSVTAIVNTADDIVLHSLQICPDLDSCLYTLSGLADTQRGWGRAAETWTVSAELAAFGAQAPWFSLGDKDIATSLIRTTLLAQGRPLSSVTAALAARHRPGVTLLPMTDDRVQTHVQVTDPDSDTGARIELHFQEWWVRYRAALPAHRITPVGARDASPAPGVLTAIATADLVLIAPSNPVVSIGTILAVPGIREALRSTPAPVVGVAPLIAGAPLRGHAEKCLAAIGVASTAEAVGAHYGARSDGGLLDGYLVADGDLAAARTALPGVRLAGDRLLMTDPAATAIMVGKCVELARG